MSDQLLVGTRKGLFDLRRGRDGWMVARTAFLGSPVNMTLVDRRDGSWYAALDLGHFGVKLHRSRDSGASWEEIQAPSYEGVGGDDPPSLALIWSLETGGSDEPGVLWAGTIPGGLFRSADHGDSWTLMRGLWDHPLREKWFGGGYDKPGVHSICVDPRDSRKIAIAVSCGGVWESPDAGATWRIGGQGMWAAYLPPEQKDEAATQDPHRMLRSPSAPDTFWVQHHNGAFRSTTGIDGWSELAVSPSSFGFALAVHPKCADTAWFVPALKDEFRYPVNGAVVVARTTDGGGSFEVLKQGLPQEHAYDLVYRHGLDVDSSGERLAMGSTTGNLWVTEDGGDVWSCAFANLPPIFSVRFV